MDQVRDEILAANQQLSERGLRVLAFAARDLDDAAMSAALSDPMGAVNDLLLIALVGIIDPLRTEAKDAVRVALAAGIDVRMITGDHTVTARAIADDLGLGPGVITGTDLPSSRTPRSSERLPELHVFGRVAPEDKVRLATADAGRRERGRHDRRRGERRGRPQAGRHRRGDGDAARR